MESEWAYFGLNPDIFSSIFLRLVADSMDPTAEYFSALLREKHLREASARARLERSMAAIDQMPSAFVRLNKTRY